MKRLYKDPLHNARFFYKQNKHVSQKPESFTSDLTNCEHECLGNELGRVFSTLHLKQIKVSDFITIQDLQDRVHKLREENPELTKTVYWHVFEDLFYRDINRYLTFGRRCIENLEDIERWLSYLDFARKNNYACFQQKVIIQVVSRTMDMVVDGCLDYDIGIKNLSCLIPQLRTPNIIECHSFINQYCCPKNLPRLAKLYKFLFKEIIGKRRFNYDLFFNDFVSDLISSFSCFVQYDEFFQGQVDILKNCLEWRFYVPSRDWRYRCDENDYLILGIIDETLRDILFPKGLVRNDALRKDIEKLLKPQCSTKFRRACKKFLTLREYASDSDAAAKTPTARLKWPKLSKD